MFETCRSVFCENRVFGSHKIPDLSSKKSADETWQKNGALFILKTIFPNFS